jgi:hypothetical protein
MFKRLLSRLRGEGPERRGQREATMSPGERSYSRERVEEHGVDEFVEEHLGGIEPNRLLDDDRPRRD